MENDTLTTEEFLALNKKKKAKSKYHSEMTLVGDIKFRSKKEARYYQNLLLLQKADEVIHIRLQPRFPYDIVYVRREDPHIYPSLTKKGCYVADFGVIYSGNDKEVIVDTKGFMTPKFKRDREIVEKLYGINIQIV